MPASAKRGSQSGSRKTVMSFLVANVLPDCLNRLFSVPLVMVAVRPKTIGAHVQCEFGKLLENACRGVGLYVADDLDEIGPRRFLDEQVNVSWNDADFKYDKLTAPRYLGHSFAKIRFNFVVQRG